MKVSQFTVQQRSSLPGSGQARLATTASMPPTRRLFRNSCQQQRPRYQHCWRTLSPLCIASTENRKTTLNCVRVVLGGVACAMLRRAHTKIKIQKFLLRGLRPFIRNFAPTKISRYTVRADSLPCDLSRSAWIFCIRRKVWVVWSDSCQKLDKQRTQYA